MKPGVALVLEQLRLRGGAGLTSLEALRAGCGSRLAARVADLKAEGFDVSAELVRVESGARVARYVLHERVEPVQLDLFTAFPDALAGAGPQATPPLPPRSGSHQVAMAAATAGGAG